MAKIIAVTGISGSGSKEFCRRYSGGKEEVKIYHTAEMIHQFAQRLGQPRIPYSNLINLHPNLLEDATQRAFAELQKSVEKNYDKYERIVIDTHAKFFWNTRWLDGSSEEHLTKMPIDMFATIIDQPAGIKARQMKTEQGMSQNHDLRDLLVWQDLEVCETTRWARRQNKPRYVLPKTQNVEDIDSLLENNFLVYSSFPMTDADEKTIEKVRNFQDKLQNLRKEIDGRSTPIIFPDFIDEKGEITQREIETLRHHAVHCDLDWYVAEASHVIAYYPDAKTQLSKGVGDECTRALETGKNTYVICPREQTSPFLDIANMVFKDEEKFFEFFKDHLRKKLSKYKRK